MGQNTSILHGYSQIIFSASSLKSEESFNEPGLHFTFHELLGQEECQPVLLEQPTPMTNLKKISAREANQSFHRGTIMFYKRRVSSLTSAQLTGNTKRKANVKIIIIRWQKSLPEDKVNGLKHVFICIYFFSLNNRCLCLKASMFCAMSYDSEELMK